MTDEQLDIHLDNILKASGSALKHYSMQKTKDDMRQALRQAIAELESQEPVAWMYVNTDGECEQIEYGEPFDDPSTTPLYTTPPQRTWVGLTDHEMYELWLSADEQKDRMAFGKAIEAKLKQKNGFAEEKNT